MIRVFFIIHSFSKGGGAEALLTSIINHLDPGRFQIGLMEIEHDTIKEEDVVVPVRQYPYYVLSQSPERNARLYHVYHNWDQVIAEYIPQGYDLYVAFNYLKPSFLLPPGKKSIVWIHKDLYDLGQETKIEERELQNKAFYKADRIVAISDITEQSLIDLFPEHKSKLRTIYNGIDIEKIRMLAKEPSSIKLQHPALLSIGRLEPRKDPIRFLNIFEKVYQNNSNVHLYYLGYGVLEKDVIRAVEERGLSGHVHLLGYYDNPFPVIAQCDVIGMFSLSEGFPMALLEGVALDKPFVSSVIGGARILSDDGICGKVVETDEEAVRAFLDLLDSEREHIKSGCRRMIQNFALESYIREIELLFEEVVSE